MSETILSKEQLLQNFAEAYEQAITQASLAEQRRGNGEDGWGPRQIVGHMAGWEVMETVRMPAIVAGMPPTDFPDDSQQTVMNNAINAAIVVLIGGQSLDTLCDMLRQVYQRNVALLKSLDGTQFRPGQYVYERTKDAVEHCKEHIEQLVAL